jgi:DNA-binding CsgD family transcriptional regulator
MTTNGFTKTETAILALLSDGERHTRGEIHGCLSDDLATDSAVKFHLSNIRQKLRQRGEDILCELSYRKIFYRHIRQLLPPPGTVMEMPPLVSSG